MSVPTTILLLVLPLAAVSASPASESLAGSAPAPVKTAAAPGSPSAQADTGGESLEQLLARLRRERTRAAGALTTRIDELLESLAALGQRPLKDAWGPLREALIDLGPEACPLLVPHLDPGPDPADGARLRARIVADVLVALPTPATTVPLLHLAGNGSPEGRVLALRALGSTPERKRVTDAVRKLHDTALGVVRDAALATLATIGGPENEELLAECLAHSEGTVIARALEALTSARNPALEPHVRDLVRSHAVAASHVPELIAYYRALPELVDATCALALVRLAADVDLSSSRRVVLLTALPAFGPKLAADLKKTLVSLSESAVGDVGEAALACRTLLGDKRAGRELLEPYDAQVDSNPNESRPLLRRAEINARIEEYADAVKDYKAALKCRDFFRRDAKEEAKVELSRCYCKLGKLKDASKWLSDASISLKRLRQLGDDPDFAELRADRRYGQVLEAR
ncbi:MAG: hypothetical protein CMK00_06785 [Planctomycetes bacterium]|nr:hypothetical protein [Planctomycetota bacterium]HJO26588.1 hypothetical protein [Planctomycetota bacterium]